MANTLATSTGNGANRHARFPGKDSLHESYVNSGRSSQHGAKAWKALLLFALFTIAITLAGYAVFQLYKESIKSNEQNELGGIAELKARQITNWMEERRGDAQALKNSPLFLAEVDRWLQQGGPAGETKTKLIALLTSLQQAYAAYGYTSISLLDDKAMLRLSSSADEAPIQGMEKARLLESMHSGQIAFSDIHREKIISGERVEIELRAPLILVKNGKTRTLGAVLFRIDPYRFIFPLIQRWPTPSPSAENLLVRRDGDDVVFLNELRHRKNAPLAMRFPLSQQQLLSTRAAMGQEGLTEGVDYRGVPVVGVLSKVAGTSWFMVSKIDQAEIYAPINQLAGWMMALMLMLVGTGGGITAFWRQKEMRLYKGELERQALSNHLDYLAKYANDIILLLDSTGKIVDFNDRALEAFGYSAEELSRLDIDDIRAIDFSLSSVERFKQVDQAGGALIFESMLVRRNGANFPVEASVRQIDIAGEKFYQAIVRDITERKMAENKLARQKDFIRQVIDSDPNLIFVKDAEGRFLLANEAMAKSYGQTTESIVGKYNWELTDNQEHLAEYDLAFREVIEKRQERMVLETTTKSDGKNYIFQTIRKPLLQDDGSVSSVLIIAMDITELKEAEQEQQRLNRALRLLSLCNAALVHADDEGELLAEICRLIVESGGYRMAWVGVAEHDPGKTVRPVARYGSDDGYLDSANISWADTELGRGPTGIAIRTGITQVNQDFRSNPQTAPWREAALARGYQSHISLRLDSGGEVFGALTIYAAEANAFSTAEVELLEELAGDLAFGMAALRTRSEHEQAVEKLRQSEEHFRFLTENASDMTYLMSMPDGRYSYVSPSSTRLTGYTPEEFYRSPMLMKTIIHPDSQAYCDAQWGSCLEGAIPAYFEFQIIHKSGEARWMYQRNAPIRKEDGSGTLIAIQGVVADVTERKQAYELQRKSSAEIEDLYNRAPCGYHSLDKDGVILMINDTELAWLGYTRDEVVGKMKFPDLISSASQQIFRENFPQFKKRGFVHDLELELIRKDGTVLVGLVNATAIYDSSGNYVMSRSTVINITERKQAESELARQEKFMWQVIDTDPNLIYVKDAAGKFLMANHALANYYGMTTREVIGKSDREINPGQKGISAYPESDVEALKGGHEVILTEPSLMPDGKQHWYLTIKKPLPQADGSVNVLGIAVDITGQKLSEMRLDESYKELQRLASHLENIREEERTRIARELHDEMGATLAALKMRVAWLASKLPPEFPLLAEETGHISGLVSDGINTMRQVVSKLRPSLLEDIGLDAAIENCVSQFRQNTNIECLLELPEKGLALEIDQSTAIFRILQESLNNIAKHSQASKVNILFTRRSNSLLMVVEDNGLGFVPNPKGKSFGLLGIRERALMAGGNAKISSMHGNGTRVSVTVPAPHSRQGSQEYAVR